LVVLSSVYDGISFRLSHPMTATLDGMAAAGGEHQLKGGAGCRLYK
jgi:hypothetical protein